MGEIARRAGADDAPDASYSDSDDARSPEEREDHRKKKGELKSEREKTAKMMDLQYFLEMVDQKHRYGSNLRAYHEEWKKAARSSSAVIPMHESKDLWQASAAPQISPGMGAETPSLVCGKSGLSSAFKRAYCRSAIATVVHHGLPGQ